MATENTT
jgi:hypothetical protein